MRTQKYAGKGELPDAIPAEVANAKGIERKAILVRQTHRMPELTRAEIRVSKMESEFRASPGSVRARVTIIPNECISEITSVLSRARQYHYEVTLPWDDRGWRLLPITEYNEYSSRWQGYLNDMAVAKTRFADGWDEMVRGRHDGLGDLFQEADYKGGPDKFLDRVEIVVQWNPVPSGDHFLLDISKEDAKALKTSVTNQVQAQVRGATSDLADRIKAAVDHMVDRFQPGVRHERKIIQKMEATLDSVQSLNIMDDPRIEKVIGQVRAAIGGMDLREPPKDELAKEIETADKRDVAEKLKKIGGAMTGYFG